MVVDTTVYIDRAAGRLPEAAGAIVDNSLLFHCSVCLSEFARGLSNRNLADPKTGLFRGYLIEFFRTIADARILTPDASTWTEAGLIAGLLARTQGFQPKQPKAFLNDALIFLTAAKSGLPVLTANRDDFDLIQQVAGRGAFIWY